jgi:hypothetical protein
MREHAAFTRLLVYGSLLMLALRFYERDLKADLHAFSSTLPEAFAADALRSKS